MTIKKALELMRVAINTFPGSIVRDDMDAEDRKNGEKWNRDMEAALAVLTAALEQNKILIGDLTQDMNEEHAPFVRVSAKSPTMTPRGRSRCSTRGKKGTERSEPPDL